MRRGFAGSAMMPSWGMCCCEAAMLRTLAPAMMPALANVHEGMLACTSNWAEAKAKAAGGKWAQTWTEVLSPGMRTGLTACTPRRQSCAAATVGRPAARAMSPAMEKARRTVCLFTGALLVVVGVRVPPRPRPAVSPDAGRTSDAETARHSRQCTMWAAGLIKRRGAAAPGLELGSAGRGLVFRRSGQ